MRSRRHTLCLWTGLALLAHTPGTRAQARSLAIYEIQGTGARSPYEGAAVVTTGVVTGRKSNGFFIQSADGAGDGRDASSDGLFVFTSAPPLAAASPGTLVAVTGRVVEFVPNADPDSPPLTELTEVTAIDVRGVGMTLPAAVEVWPADRPLVPNGADPLERLEGMRVRVASLTTVSGTLGTVNETNATGASNGVFYGVITGVGRPFRQPGIGFDESLPPGSPCCVPRHLSNRARLRVDSDGQPGATAVNVPSGSVVRNLVGPLDFAFRAYTVLPDPGSPPQVTAAPAFDPVRRPAEDEVAVASFNLQRFFDTTDDPSVGDVVLSPAAFQTRLRKASLYIRRLLHLPHVIGVQEVENLATLRALAETLNREAREARELKPRYEAYLEEGNDPGGIDVGLLVDRARVEVLQVAQEGRSEQFRTPAGQLELLHDRPPLALRARILWPTAATPPVTVVVAHLRSLIDIDHPVNGPRVRLKRALQAESLAAMLDRRLSVDALDALLVVGDMNAFEFSDGFVDVVGTLRGVPAPRDAVVQPTRDLVSPDLTNLVEGVPPQDRYSYVFDGVAQTLDHMLVSAALLPLVTAFGHARGNADAPEVWRSDGSRPERLSDHDPALVYLTFPRH